jgi:RNA polymerase sigma-54 factor
VIVESLDDDGYLRTPLEDLLSLADLTPPATLAEMELALQRVRSLEPAGVGRAAWPSACVCGCRPSSAPS